jgi:hypothetical protein
MRPAAAPAGGTRLAAAVDFADDAAAPVRTGLCDADELVPEHPAKSHVPLDQLKIRLTDAGAGDPDQHIVRAR